MSKTVIIEDSYGFPLEVSLEPKGAIAEMATARSTIKKYEGLKSKKVWTKQEILGVAHALTALDQGSSRAENMDEEMKYLLHELLGMFSEGTQIDITSDQSQQGIDWLRKNVVNSKGQLRDTGMVREAGFDQESVHIIQNFQRFELVGFHNDERSHSYAPIYRTIASDGKYFDYSVSGGWGGASIILHET